MTLKQQTFSAVRWTTVAMLSKAGFQFAQIIILARLLSPADFGLMAIVVAILTFAQIFSDMGISNAIIHHQAITHKELSSLFWLNVCAGAVLTLLLFTISPLIATYYGAVELKILLMVISAYFVIAALGQQLRIVAEKELQFSPLAYIEIISSLSGFLVLVIWVWQQASVMALVVSLITSISVTTILNWVVLSKGWRPLWRLKLTEIKKFLSFGGYTMLNNTVNSLNMQADVFIGGRMLSAAELGVYSLPRDLGLRLSSIINPIVTKVGLPVMAKSQYDKKLLKNIYLKTLRMTASVNAPLYLAMFVFAPEIVKLLFGSQWGESADLLRVLALWSLFRSFGNPVGSLLFAAGRADLAFKWNLGLFFIIWPILWLGLQWGSEGLVVAQLLLMIVLFIPSWFFLVRPLCGAELKEYSVNLMLPSLIAVLASFVAYFSTVGIVQVMIKLFIGLLIGAIVYIIMSWVWNKQWVDAMRTLMRRS